MENAEFYPFVQGATDVIANAAEQTVVPHSDGLRLYVKRSPDLAALPATLGGVLRLSDTVAYVVSAPVTQVANVATPAAAGGSAGGVTALGAIGLAFVGGIILNLMPCVFPVLFLKGLALMQTAGAGSAQERAHLRRHGLVYALGILVSFWAIVAVLLALRATGSHAGWGFQLQSPGFLAVLASFMFFFALSLAGQFDIGLSLTSVGGDLAQKQGYAGSFFTGVLATVVATPSRPAGSMPSSTFWAGHVGPAASTRATATATRAVERAVPGPPPPAPWSSSTPSRCAGVPPKATSSARSRASGPARSRPPPSCSQKAGSSTSSRKASTSRR